MIPNKPKCDTWKIVILGKLSFPSLYACIINFVSFSNLITVYPFKKPYTVISIIF